MRGHPGLCMPTWTPSAPLLLAAVSLRSYPARSARQQGAFTPWPGGAGGRHPHAWPNPAIPAARARVRQADEFAEASSPSEAQPRHTTARPGPCPFGSPGSTTSANCGDQCALDRERGAPSALVPRREVGPGDGAGHLCTRDPARPPAGSLPASSSARSPVGRRPAHRRVRSPMPLRSSTAGDRVTVSARVRVVAGRTSSPPGRGEIPSSRDDCEVPPSWIATTAGVFPEWEPLRCRQGSDMFDAPLRTTTLAALPGRYAPANVPWRSSLSNMLSCANAPRGCGFDELWPGRVVWRRRPRRNPSDCFRHARR